MSELGVKRAFKFRFYPSELQADELARTFGCVRLVYNKALAIRTEAWYQRGERIGYNATSAMLTSWKKSHELAFLNDVSSVPLQQALRHLQKAFVNFWEKRARYPRFKARKRSRASAHYTSSAFSWRNGQLWLAKLAEPLNIVWSRRLPREATPSSVTVSRDAAGRWFVSILVADTTVRSLPSSDRAVGVDAGIASLLTLSTGEKVANPRFRERERERLRRAQRCLSRKQKGSKNRSKARVKVARIQGKVADRRRDHLDKVTTRLVRENQVIAIEDLSVRNMLKNRKLARSISAAGWAAFRSMLEYKAHWYGRELVVVDRWYPSSRICSACGHSKDSLPLNVREWKCGCGAIHDRDVNAAKNILAAGLGVSACGDGVRPARAPRGTAGVAEAGTRYREVADLARF